MGGGGSGGQPECQIPDDCDDDNECCFGDLPGVCADGVCQGLCEGVSCDDNECRTDGTCDASDGTCDYTFTEEDGTACSEGECLDGVCAPVGAFPCTEQGIRDAIAEGGGPHFFACDGTTPVVTEAEILIDNDVVLDGKGNLAVDGNEDHRVFSVAMGVTAELRGLAAIRGVGNGGGILNRGTMTLTNSTVSGNTGYGIFNRFGFNEGGTMTLTNSTVSGNTEHGIFNQGGTVTLTHSLVDGTCNPSINITSNGHNIESLVDTCRFDQPTDQVNVSADDLNLGPLQDNGGPTRSSPVASPST